jgi:hypothetical protein
MKSLPGPLDHPADWRRDPRGHPQWLDEPGGEWARIGGLFHLPDGSVLNLRAPSSWPRSALERRPRFRQPPFAERDREDLERRAWLVDVCGWSPYRVARDLEGGTDAGRKKRAWQSVADGRLSLRARGVLPWATFPEGHPPDTWWCTQEWLDAVLRWHYRAQFRAVRSAARRGSRVSDHMLERLAAGRA